MTCFMMNRCVFTSSLLVLIARYGLGFCFPFSPIWFNPLKLAAIDRSLTQKARLSIGRSPEGETMSELLA